MNSTLACSLLLWKKELPACCLWLTRFRLNKNSACINKAHYTKNITYIFYSTDLSFNTNPIHKQSISRFLPQPNTFAFYICRIWTVKHTDSMPQLFAWPSITFNSKERKYLLLLRNTEDQRLLNMLSVLQNM